MSAPVESVSEKPAAGGHFSVAGRRAAIAAALPLVATYFRQKGDLGFNPQVGLEVGHYDSAHQEVLDALRLRVAMAAATRVLELARSALRRPSFRYGQVGEEQVGALRGRLDARAFISQQGRTREVARFPVISVSRQSTTPENVLVAAAVLQVIRELRSPMARNLPLPAPDRRRATRLAQGLDEFLRVSQLQDCVVLARNELVRGRIGALTETVRRRLRAGHVGGPEPYEGMVDWVSRGLEGRPAVGAEELHWDFYDSSFDTTLFEIWCLSELKSELEARLGAAERETRVIVGVDGAVATWYCDAVEVNLYFQKEPNTSNHLMEPRWQGRGKRIRGRPDITVEVSSPGGWRMIILDPKLRQRANSEPTEELYKILGYFNNFKLDGDGYGGILYSAPEPQPLNSTSYEAIGHSGQLLAVALDPERPEGNRAGWNMILDLILAPTTLEGCNQARS